MVILSASQLLAMAAAATTNQPSLEAGTETVRAVVATATWVGDRETIYTAMFGAITTIAALIVQVISPYGPRLQTPRELPK